MFDNAIRFRGTIIPPYTETDSMSVEAMFEVPDPKSYIYSQATEVMIGIEVSTQLGNMAVEVINYIDLLSAHTRNLSTEVMFQIDEALTWTRNLSVEVMFNKPTPTTATIDTVSVEAIMYE